MNNLEQMFMHGTYTSDYNQVHANSLSEPTTYKQRKLQGWKLILLGLLVLCLYCMVTQPNKPTTTRNPYKPVPAEQRPQYPTNYYKIQKGRISVSSKDKARIWERLQHARAAVKEHQRWIDKGGIGAFGARADLYKAKKEVERWQKEWNRVRKSHDPK